MVMQTIEWHKRCIENFEKSIANKILDFNALKEEINNEVKRLTFQKHQVKEAEKKGKTSYDNERFCITRNKKENSFFLDWNKVISEEL